MEQFRLTTPFILCKVPSLQVTLIYLNLPTTGVFKNTSSFIKTSRLPSNFYTAQRILKYAQIPDAIVFLLRKRSANNFYSKNPLPTTNADVEIISINHRRYITTKIVMQTTLKAFLWNTPGASPKHAKVSRSARASLSVFEIIDTISQRQTKYRGGAGERKSRRERFTIASSRVSRIPLETEWAVSSAYS